MTEKSHEKGLADIVVEKARPKLEEALLAPDAPEAEKRELTPEQETELLSALETRLNKEPEHYKRPAGITFAEVRAALKARPDLMYSLAQMENTGGLPDIIAVRAEAFVFGDSSAESPDRRNLTRDQAAEMAKAFGVEMMPWGLYSDMVEYGAFDVFDHKTMSWLGEGYDEDDKDDEKDDGFATVGHPSYETDPFYRNTIERQIANGHHPTIGWRGILIVPKTPKVLS